MKRLITTTFLLLWGLSASLAQNFKSDLKKLQAQVETAYKNKKVTEIEYGKLKEEHDIINLAIEKAEADATVTQDEKNKIYSKILRARKRLAKYKTNAEVH
jgi:DNA polymerase II small subunit/DNA polymerase delta subunit B